MKRHILLAAVAALAALCLTSPARAQFYPGYGYGGWGGYDGSAALLGGDLRQSAIIGAKTQSRLQGEQAAQAQNAVVQSGIRNTLSSQAQGRDSQIQQQQQQTQDWWFQQQARQTAERNAMSVNSSATAPTSGWGSYGPAGPGFGPAGRPPPAATDIIQWPALLQDSCFASERGQIEAPYRHGPPPKLSTPTVADYRQMVRTVEDMKAVLEWRPTKGADTNEYNTAKAFLNKLGQEMSARAQGS